MKAKINFNRRASFKTDAKISSIDWMTKFNFQLDYIVPVKEDYIAFSGGSQGHGLFDIRNQSLKWFYEEAFDWTGPAIVYKDYLIFPKKSSLYIHDIESANLF